jgi:3-(3-hydroxy-phenyl)propionate hydroxylase
MSKRFASHADLEEKKVSFDKLSQSWLNTPDRDAYAGAMTPGAPQGAGKDGAVPEGGAPGIAIVEDAQGLLARRYDACAGTCYLLRPDQHVCARWRDFDTAALTAALARAACNA